MRTIEAEVNNAHCKVAAAYIYPHSATPPPGKYPDLIFQATDTVRALSLSPQHTLLCQGFTSFTRNAAPQWLPAHSNYCRGGSSYFAEAEDMMGTANEENRRSCMSQKEEIHAKWRINARYSSILRNQMVIADSKIAVKSPHSSQGQRRSCPRPKAF